MFSKIDHVAIHVKEINKVIKFYKDIFGFKILFENLIPSGKKVVYLKLGDTILEINESCEGKITGCHFCLHTDNFEYDYNSLIDKGIEIFQPIISLVKISIIVARYMNRP